MKTEFSIIVPVRNEEVTIGACLAAIFSQESEKKFEVLLIDSGSTDRTLEIACSFREVRIIKISPEEFGHGRTRNLGARETSGSCLVFLNGDAVPQGTRWLPELLQCLESDPACAAAYSRHLPRNDCRLYMRRDLEKSMPGRAFVRKSDQKMTFTQFSTVSCAIRRETWERFPFEEAIDISEDQHWARRALREGLQIAYCPQSAVVHSHNYEPKELYAIKKRMAAADNPFKWRISALTLGFLLCGGGFFTKFMGDIPYILKQHIPFRMKVRELWHAKLARFYSFAGRYAGWTSPKSGSIKER